MADIYDPQTDSDEDCEVYFLKPVNEYNIVDKIKEANKELFSDANPEKKNNFDTMESESTTVNISTTTSTTTTTTTTTKITTMRKVTFAENLEDYEPESPMKGDGEHFSEDADSFNKSERIKFPTIDEEEQTALDENFITNCEPSQLTEGIDDQISDTNVNSKADYDNEDNDDDDVDDICEEIIVMEMESDTMCKVSPKFTRNDSFSLHHRRAVLKQTTFDCDEDQEQDNKSLMNLLTASDGEEDDSRGQISNSGNCCNNNDDYSNDVDDINDSDSIFNGIIDFDDEVNAPNNYDDDDDDDKLSLIVASYLPDDFERATIINPILPSPKQQICSAVRTRSYFRRKTNKGTTTCNNNNKSPLSSSSSSKSASLTTSLGKRFQLRRKAYSTNSIGTVNSNDAAGNSTNAINRNTDNLIGLKLNYKTCCEYRNSIQGKLPKYTGYLSEYGLSREQLQQREQKVQKKQRFILEQAIKTNEHDMRKMQDNERAFTTWLRNKMRFPINKTRNMFDVKLKFTGKKKATSENGVSQNGNSNGKNVGPLGCVAKLRTN